MTEEAKLLPCPFCGKPPSVSNNLHTCSCRDKMYWSSKEDWNTRSLEAAKQVLSEITNEHPLEVNKAVNIFLYELCDEELDKALASNPRTKLAFSLAVKAMIAEAQK